VVAERLQIHHHSAVELFNRLESRGLIQRSCGTRDRREVLVNLTQEGEKLLHGLSASHYEELLTAGPRLLKALKRVIRAKRSSKPSSSLPRNRRIAKRERKATNLSR
jgi:DNA-binding MarR family transcriptional regulator